MRGNRRIRTVNRRARQAERKRVERAKAARLAAKIPADQYSP